MAEEQNRKEHRLKEHNLEEYNLKGKGAALPSGRTEAPVCEDSAPGVSICGVSAPGVSICGVSVPEAPACESRAPGADSGKSLEAILNEEGENITLWSAAEQIRLILNALEQFHGKGLLHLDICPENILIFPDQALFLDCSHAFCLQEGKPAGLVFDDRDGCRAPEVLLREYSQFGYGTDIYSVCAIFFQMLTGQKLPEDAWRGNRIRKSLTPDLKIFRDEPETVVYGVRGIVFRGLAILQRRRWPGAAAMRSALDEVLMRAEPDRIPV